MKRNLWVYPLCRTGIIWLFLGGSEFRPLFWLVPYMLHWTGIKDKTLAISFPILLCPKTKHGICYHVHFILHLESITFPKCFHAVQNTNHDNHIGCYLEGIQTLFTLTCINRHSINVRKKIWVTKIPDLCDWAVGEPHLHAHTHTRHVHKQSEGAKVHSWTHHYNRIN